MRDFVNIKSESDLFQWLKTWTEYWIYWERIEPANECGFPDTTYVMKNNPGQKRRPSIEGAIEFKYTEKYSKLYPLMRRSQIVSFVDYEKAGGTKRFVFKYIKYTQTLEIYTTNRVVVSIGGSDKPYRKIEFEGRTGEDIAKDILEFMELFG